MIISDDAHYGAIDASQHQTSLDLLREVADYLSRLPAHPMTHAVRLKVVAHVRSPGTRAQIARLAMLSNCEDFAARIASGNGFEGDSRYTPSGAPVIAASLIYPTLRLDSPAIQACLNRGDHAKADSLASAIGRDLTGGVSIDLSPIHPVHDP